MAAQRVTKNGKSATDVSAHDDIDEEILEEIPIDGLLWKWATDWRMAFSGLSQGVLQLMHPGLGAGVEQHSDFFNEPFARIERSIGPIVASIRDDDTARAIKKMHRHIGGVDQNGKRYHALNPEVFWWAHITLYRAAELAARRFSFQGLSEEQRDSMYREGMMWYRRYGVSEDGVPETRQGYTEKFQRICAEELVMTPSAERAIDMALHDRVTGAFKLPDIVATPIEIAVTPVARLTTIGGLPSVVRRRFGIPWGIQDDLQYRSLIMAVREASLLMPERVRRGNMRRVAAQSRLNPDDVGPAGLRGLAAKRKAEENAKAKASTAETST